MLASDAGYGYVATIGDMITKNKAGKAQVSVPNGGLTLQPAQVSDIEHEYVAAFSNEGRLLIFPLSELPQMARGKGVKIMNIPTARLKERLEFMSHLLVFSEVDTLIVHSGKRNLNLKIDDLQHYRGERARRGLKLPRGFQKVDAVSLQKGD